MNENESDVYNVQQAGAVGRNARVETVNFTMEGVQKKVDLDLEKLTEDLAKLIKELEKTDIDEIDKDSSVNAVKQAQSAAKSGDGPEALKHLQNVGKWVLGIAEKIGVGVAVVALKTVLGL